MKGLYVQFLESAAKKGVEQKPTAKELEEFVKEKYGS